MRTRLFAVVPLLITGLALGGCGSKSEGATDPSNLNNPCPPGQFCPQPSATVTTPPPNTTLPPAASSASSATPLPPLGAAAVTPILTGMGQTEAPGAKADGSPIAGQFQEGQTLEGAINIQPNKCYTIVGASVGITELHIQLVVQPLPGAAAVPLAQDNGTGPSPVLGGKKDGCWRNPTPLGGPGKVILKATKGAGMAGAQVFVK